MKDVGNTPAILLHITVSWNNSGSDRRHSYQIKMHSKRAKFGVTVEEPPVQYAHANICIYMYSVFSQEKMNTFMNMLGVDPIKCHRGQNVQIQTGLRKNEVRVYHPTEAFVLGRKASTQI